MEQEKNRNNGGVFALTAVIIVILVTLAALFATGAIGFKSDNGSSDDITGNTDSPPSTEQIDSGWTDYLLSRHILEAKITRIRSKDLGDTEDYNQTVTITMDDVREIMSELKDSKLSKTWSEGRGGPDKDHLTISYEYNDQKYEFEIYYGTIAVDKLDDEFKAILENSKYEEKNTEYKSSQGAFYFYGISDYTDTIFDKYFK